MKTISLFLLYVIAPLVLAAQPVSLGIGFGRASCAMDDLKLWNNDLSESIDFENGITSSFPDWWTFSIQSKIFISKRLNTCVNYYYNSSGSGISSKDYSGEYRIDHIVNGHSLGTGIFYRIIPTGKTEILAGIEAGGTYSRSRLIEEVDTDLVSEKDVTYFTAWGIYALPAIEISYPLGPVVPGIKMGYNFHFMGRLRYHNHPITTTGRKHNIKADWTGYRFLLTIGIPISKK